MTTIQSALNKLQAFQECKGFQLGGKGPELKNLAAEIKYLWPTLNEEDKALFTAAVARGRFSIESKYIWPLFCEAVGAPVPTPAPKPAAPAAASPAAPAATNKVAGEILDMAKGHLVGLKLIDKTLGLHMLCMERQLTQINGQGDNLNLNNDRMHILHEIVLDLKEMVKDLQEQVSTLKKPATRRTTSV